MDATLPMNRTPLIPSFSPSGGEGARRAVEGDFHRKRLGREVSYGIITPRKLPSHFSAMQ
jgi:hypothetical protein